MSHSLAFSTFPDPRTSLPDPIPLTKLPSTFPTNASITSFKRSSSRAMSLSTTAKASPVLCHRSPTLIIRNACAFCRISLVGFFTLWTINAHRRRITRWSKHLENVREIIPPRLAQWIAQALSNIYHQPLYPANGFLGRNLDLLDPDFVSFLRGNATGYEATPGGEGSGSINPFVPDCFLAKRLQRRCIHVMRPWSRHSSPSSLCIIPRLDERIQSGVLQLSKKRSVTMALTTLNNSSPCVAGEFRSALETLSETLEETEGERV